MTRKEVERAARLLNSLDEVRGDLKALNWVAAEQGCSVTLHYGSGTPPRTVWFTATDLKPIVQERLDKVTAALTALDVTEF